MGPRARTAHISQRLINGNGAVPPMPVVFGISATVERFEAAMKTPRAGPRCPRWR